MSNIFLKFASCTVILLLVSVVAGQNMSAYAAYPNYPSFGGGKVNNYSDGLVINGKTFNISKFSQKLATPQILPIGKSSTITLKLYDNDGPTTIKSVTLGLNIHGNNLVFGDTYAQYFMTNHFVAVNDPDKLLGAVTADYKIVQPFVYVTFHITPIAKMDTSNMIVSAMDDHNAVTNSLVIDAIKFSSSTLVASTSTAGMYQRHGLTGVTFDSTTFQNQIESSECNNVGPYADLRGCDLSNHILINANLFHANLSHANLINADLSNADLSGANLSDANLFYANLYGANLSGANLSGAVVTNANLGGAITTGITPPTLSGCIHNPVCV